MSNSRAATVKLSILRDIGWRCWDPIGLGNPGGGCDQDCADEYDNYLLAAATRLQNGEAQDRVVEYLVDIEARHMGLGHSAAAHERAVITVKAIRDHLVVQS